MFGRSSVSGSALAAWLIAFTAFAHAAPPPTEFDRTPPRLAFVQGDASFLREGAQDWTPALPNTPLARGDRLYTDAAANLEMQIGTRAFLRAGEHTEVGILALEPKFLQVRMGTGHLSLDLRSVDAGHAFEIDTPAGAFTIARSGYYRIAVAGDTTTFIARRGGRATATTAGGKVYEIAPSEQVVFAGAGEPRIESFAAPEPDPWDRWNFERSDRLIDSVSARYVPAGVYGVDDLDHHGDWRVVAEYGPVWIPRVAAGWAPYGAGTWIHDPDFGWTWVDDAPWGWAPFHYGRWIRIGEFWGWAPGPIAARQWYAPALVAFYGLPETSIAVSITAAPVAWIALGWGEPCIPWWGPPAMRGHPHWLGWGGPRIVNDVVVARTRTVRAADIHAYRNAALPGALVGVPVDRFGRGRLHPVALEHREFDRLRPIHGALPLAPTRASLAPAQGRAKRPDDAIARRAVVARRALPARVPAPAFAREPDRTPPPRIDPAPVVRLAPMVDGKAQERLRPPFARGGDRERMPPPQPPRFQGLAAPDAQRGSIPAPAARTERRASPGPAAAAGQTRRDLPGDPANRVFHGRRDEGTRQRHEDGRGR
ncbi:MAG: DUF6600 domain-containing protein [Gammaproteobacteria bacterium]